MALLVLAYPELSDADSAWIEAVRERHDHAAGVVRAHFTLVYPLGGVAPEELLAHARAVAAGCGPIAFTLRVALPWRDVIGPETQAYLVSDEGFSALARLHDHLYGGPLAAHLRLDIPCIPHLTIARSRDPRACKTLADELNARNFALAGRVEHLDVVEHTPGRVETIGRVALGQQSAR